MKPKLDIRGHKVIQGAPGVPLSLDGVLKYERRHPNERCIQSLTQTWLSAHFGKQFIGALGAPKPNEPKRWGSFFHPIEHRALNIHFAHITTEIPKKYATPCEKKPNSGF